MFRPAGQRPPRHSSSGAPSISHRASGLGARRWASPTRPPATRPGAVGGGTAQDRGLTQSASRQLPAGPGRGRPSRCGSLTTVLQVFGPPPARPAPGSFTNRTGEAGGPGRRPPRITTPSPEVGGEGGAVGSHPRMGLGGRQCGRSRDLSFGAARRRSRPGAANSRNTRDHPGPAESRPGRRASVGQPPGPPALGSGHHRRETDPDLLLRRVRPAGGRPRPVV